MTSGYQPKQEARVEGWWINTMLTGTLLLYGDFYNFPGEQDGKFGIVDIDRVDMINLVAESPEAYIKLGKQMDLKDLDKDEDYKPE